MINKLIIIPNVGEDLFSLKTKYGIMRGPIKTPTAFPIEVIKALVNQYNKPLIQEVIAVTPGVFSAPVTLTPENYALPYEEIAGVEPLVATTLTETNPDATQGGTDPVETFPEGTETEEQITPPAADADVVDQALETVTEEVIIEEVEAPVVEEVLEEVQEPTAEVNQEAPVVEEVTEDAEASTVAPVNNGKHVKVKNK